MSRRVYLIPSGSASWRGIIQRAAGPTPAPRPRWWQLALAFLDQVWP
jgi:hypothetical protein